MTRCNNDLRQAGEAYPRTCAKCGLGPCPQTLANQLAQSQAGAQTAPISSPARASGLTKAEEAAMELALIRPDLVSHEQVQTIAHALKNRTVGKANLPLPQSQSDQMRASNFMAGGPAW